MALAGQVPNFLFHHQTHQRQAGLSQQMADAVLQHADDVGHRQDHLDVGILLGSEPAELLHRSLTVDLVLLLHSDSPFSWRKNIPKATMPSGVRVATFYDLPGILLPVMALEIDEEGTVAQKSMQLTRQGQLANTLLDALYPGIRVATVEIPGAELDDYGRAKVEQALARFTVGGVEYRLIGASGSA